MSITPGTSTATSGNLTTGFTLVINAGVVTNDVLLLGVTNRGATTDPVVTDNDTGGNLWAKVGNQNANTNGAITVWWKRATSATASKTITVSLCTNSAAGCVTPYSGCITTGTPHGTPVSEANASADEAQAGITTTAAASYVCLFVGLTSNDTLNPNTYVATDPTALTERAEGVSAGGSDCSMSHASAERATAGATGAISWSQTDGTGASMAFELLAAPVPILGDLGVTIAAITSSAAGGVAIAGSESSTIAAVTSSATGVLPIVGSESSAIDAILSDAAGTVTVQGAAEVAIGDIAISAAGTVADVGAISGELVATIAAIAASAAGVVAVQGATASQVDAVTASAAAVVQVQGATSATVDAITSSAVGAVQTHGEATPTVDAVTASAAGGVAIVGSASSTIDPVTLAASGSSAGSVSGELAAEIAAVTLAASGAGSNTATVILDDCTYGWISLHRDETMEETAARVLELIGNATDETATALRESIADGFLSKHRDARMEEVNAWMRGMLDDG